MRTYLPNLIHATFNLVHYQSTPSTRIMGTFRDDSVVPRTPTSVFQLNKSDHPSGTTLGSQVIFFISFHIGFSTWLIQLENGTMILENNLEGFFFSLNVQLLDD